MKPSELLHALVYKPPLDPDEIVALRNQLWRFNTRSHGDHEDQFIWVEGFVTKQAEDAYRFWYNTPLGIMTLDLEPFEVTYRLTQYVVLT